MSRRRILVAGALVAALGWPVVGWAQSTISAEGMFTTRVVIGGTTFGTTSPLQVMGLPTLAGSLVTVDGSGNIGIGGAATAPSSLAVTGALSANGNVTLGDASGDTINFSGRVNTTILWTTDNLVDMGASGANRPRDFNLARNAAIGGTLGVTGASTLAALSATTGSFSSTLGVTGAATFGADAGTADYVSRTTGWRITEPGAGDFRQFFSNVLQVQQFEVDLTSVIAGTQRVTKSASTVSQVFTCPATSATATLWVKDKPSLPNARVFASGDHVSIQTAARADADSDGNLEFSVSDCVGVVTSYADGTSGNDGQQSWTFTRGSATGGAGGSMSTGTVVAVDGVAIDYGTPGMGFAETTAVDGTEGGNSPYLQFARWATSPIAANVTVDCRFGNLSGAYGYASSSGIFGMACGAAAATNVTVDPTNGFRIRSGTTPKFAADTSGNLSLTGDLAMGTAGVIRSGATALDTATGYWLAHNAGTPQFRIGTMSGSTLTKGIRWDGTNIKLQADTVAIDETGIIVNMSSGSASAARSYKFDAGAGSGTGALAWYGTYSSGSTSRTSYLQNSTNTSGWEATTTIDTSYFPGGGVAGDQSRVDFAAGGGAPSAILQVVDYDSLNSVTYTQIETSAKWVVTSGTAELFIKNGQVGVNTETPAYALDVTGEINATSTGYLRGGALVTGAFSLGASASAGTMSFSHPTWTQFIGDGTGYTWALAKRSSSTTTNVLTVNDSTNLVTALGTVAAAAFTANGSAGIDMNANPTTCSNLQFVKGILVAKTGC